MQGMTINVIELIATHLSAAEVRAMTESWRATGENLGCGMFTGSPLNIAALFWCCLAALLVPKTVSAVWLTISGAS